MSTVGSQLEGLPELKSMWPVHQVYGHVQSGMPLASVDTVALEKSNLSALSSVYMRQAKASCRLLFMHCTPCAFSLARDNAGSSSAARIAMMAMTTSSSISVNPRARHSGRRVNEPGVLVFMNGLALRGLTV